MCDGAAGHPGRKDDGVLIDRARASLAHSTPAPVSC
jgi:hypothetical protein